MINMKQYTISKILINGLVNLWKCLRDTYSKHPIRIYHECEGRIEKSVPKISFHKPPDAKR